MENNKERDPGIFIVIIMISLVMAFAVGAMYYINNHAAKQLTQENRVLQGQVEFLSSSLKHQIFLTYKLNNALKRCSHDVDKMREELDKFRENNPHKR